MKNGNIVILMGVSGSGKSTIGKRLSERQGWYFIDGDDYHPKENIRKMSSGIPLSDENREPWLNTLNGFMHEYLDADKPLILACSALKQKYRDSLRAGFGNADVTYVYLKGNYELIQNRLQSRAGHYMKPEMLCSQIKILEEPEDAIVINISENLDDIVEEIVTILNPYL